VSEPCDPFAAVEKALGMTVEPTTGQSIARVDAMRQQRTGVPEVVFGDAKDDASLLVICRDLLEELPRVIVSRVDEQRANRIVKELENTSIERPYPGRTVVLSRPGSAPPCPNGRIAIFTAGTSDLPVAGEAATLAREMGCAVELVADVGVAGLHRLVVPLRRVVRSGVDAIIVAAGMDGALPSVISGLVDVPVIGLPISVGYGVAAGGHAALNTMLATCAPGMAVVNIDNGIGAGAMAARIALRSARSARTPAAASSPEYRDTMGR
jgi:NCAIR mutase (PurE)-related protein